jgi:protein-disulfide isomerase
MISRVIGFLAILFCFSSVSVAQDSASTEPTSTKTVESVLQIDPKAPVKIFEYASLSCSHCAAFHSDTFPKLMENYVDTGKAVFVFRDFPLDEPALRASMLAHCSGEKQSKFLKTMFKTQNNWAPKKNYLEILSNIAKLGGMTGAEFNVCIQDQSLERIIVAKKFDAVKVLEVRSTPTLYVNGQKYEGSRGYDYFTKVIDAELNGTSAP